MSIFEISWRKRLKNNSSTTVVTKMQTFCLTSLFSDSLKTHVAFVRRDVQRQWLISYVRYARLRNLSNSNVWTKQLSRWDRSCAVSRLVLPTNYIFNCLHKYLACFKLNRGFISGIYPVPFFKNGCSRMLVTICTLLNKEHAFFKQTI